MAVDSFAQDPTDHVLLHMAARSQRGCSPKLGSTTVTPAKRTEFRHQEQPHFSCYRREAIWQVGSGVITNRCSGVQLSSACCSVTCSPLKPLPPHSLTVASGYAGPVSCCQVIQKEVADSHASAALRNRSRTEGSTHKEMLQSWVTAQSSIWQLPTAQDSNHTLGCTMAEGLLPPEMVLLSIPSVPMLTNHILEGLRGGTILTALRL